MRKMYRYITMGITVTALLFTLSACGEKPDIGTETGHLISVNVQEENISKALETEVRNEENEKTDMAVPADSQKSEPEESNVEKSEAEKPDAQPKKAEDKDSVTADKSKDKAEATKKSTSEHSKETANKTEQKKDTKKTEAKKTSAEPKKNSSQPAEKKAETKSKDSSPKTDSTKKSDSETADTGKKTKPDAGENEDSADNQPKPKHEHQWEPVYEEQIIEDIEGDMREICKGCGCDITDWSNDKWISHTNEHMANGEESGFYEKEVKVVTATHKIKKLTGYKCSCGATKEK